MDREIHSDGTGIAMILLAAQHLLVALGAGGPVLELPLEFGLC